MQTRIVSLLVVAAALVGCSKSGDATGTASGAKPAAANHAAASPATAKPTGPKQPDGVAILGKWEITSFNHNGKAWTKDVGKVVEFTPTEMIIHESWGTFVQTYVLNPSTKAIDLDNAKKTRKLAGIYHVNGDQLHFAQGEPNTNVRPKEFKPGKDVLLMVLRRKQ